MENVESKKEVQVEKKPDVKKEIESKFVIL